jgi:meso-butanediol dehydrogenase / (S,S)-butanediol dehydrogenase / diacetyl reductase
VIADLRGQTALVTGSGTAGGMGALIAAILAEQGADVAVADVDAGGAQQVAAAIGGTALSLELDVASLASIDSAFSKLEEAWPTIDIVVNNVGIGHAAPGSGESDWEATFRVNLMGTVNCTERALPGMCERRHGKVINIASISGHAARGTGGAYSVSKAAVLRYTKGLAVEVAPFSVNVNAVCPGAVWTGMQSGPFQKPEEVDQRLAGLEPYEAFLEYYRPITPLGRPQTAEEVGKAVAYLASADARNITGQCLHVDGGAIRD